MPLTTTRVPNADLWVEGTGAFRLSGSTTQDDGVTLRRSLAGEPGSPQAFLSAFDFLQRNADGRYSDRTLMAISRWSGRSEDILMNDAEHPGEAPWVFSASKEVSYDEDTEVKSGGIVGLAVAMPAEYGYRLVMAVHADARRQGYAQRLVQYAQGFVGGLHAWVGNSNVIGQQFLLRVGMMPTSMNGRGALLYSFGDMPESDGVAR